MSPLSIYQAAQIEGAPTRAYLSRLAKKENRPAFFLKDGDSWVIDVDCSTWKELIKRRAKKAPTTGTSKTKQSKSSKTESKEKKTFKGESEIGNNPLEGKSIFQLKLKKLEEDVKEKEIKNEISYLEMQKKSGNIIDFNLANYLFFSYMEKANVDFLRAAKKNEARIDNFVKEGKTRAIVKLFENEATAILKEIIKSQKLSLEKWKDEEGIK